MNIDAVIKRLEALEGKITGKTHIESIIVGIPGKYGNMAACNNPETYQGQFLVHEHVFMKIDKAWNYQPRKFLISNYQNYKPPADFRNAVIYLIRRGQVPISQYAQETIDKAIKAVEAANNELKGDNLQ